MKKLNVAIITGGNVAERGISLKSAQTVHKHLPKDRYRSFVLDLEGRDFTELASGEKIDKNDFSLQLGGEIIHFDLAFLMLHGHPAEDGCLQGYLDIIGIPYTGCDHFVSSLTFNKQACKDFLHRHNIPMASSMLLHKGDPIDWVGLNTLGLPLFVKPNKNGSSYGISKVTESTAIAAAIDLAFQYDDEIIVEAFIKGQEFSNGVLRKDGDIIVMPITEIVSKNDFFDYKAKYLSESEEITPARLSDDMRRRCQAQSKKLYQALGCMGMTRFDYILKDETFYFLEANTIPGMSEASIFPQQAIAHGWTISEMLEAIVEEALSKVESPSQT
ncbi:MAG: D-alanine--D-alanine ligase family protein [Bacteroidota bacterium]